MSFFGRKTIWRPAMAAACALIGALATTFVAPADAQGTGDLTVSPTRVVFENRTRSAQLALIHRGKARATYRLSFVQMQMSEQGELVEVNAGEPGEAAADQLVRFSPRQVTLEPGVAQTVRLLLRKPAELASGEYRSHLLLRAIPAAGAGDSIEALGDEDGGIAVALTPIYGVAVPVIVRHGELTATVQLSDLALEPPSDASSEPTISLLLERGGERSLYGDLAVTYIPSDGRPETVLGLYKGLAVYTPNRVRNLSLRLALPEGLDFNGGHLRVSFSESESAEAAAAVAQLPLS